MSGLVLRIENFQSISDIELTFNEGDISLITGESNSGKSASIRALKALLLNTAGAQRYIKHGEEFARVTLSYKGNNIVWKRTKKEAEYTINGKKYSKLGSSNLFKILDGDIGFSIDDKNDILNIEGEWQVLFPFDKSNTELFKLYENVFSVTNSNEIFQSFKATEDGLNSSLQDALTKIAKNDSKLKSIEDFQQEVDVDVLVQRKEILVGLLNKYSKLFADSSIVDSSINFLVLLPKDKKIKYLNSENLNRYTKLIRDYTSVNTAAKYIGCFKGTGKSESACLTNVSRLLKLDRDIKQLDKIDLFVKSVTKLSNSSFIDNSNIGIYLKLRKDLQQLDNLCNILGIIERFNIKNQPSNTNLLDKYATLKKDLSSLDTLANDIKEIKGEISKTNIRIEEINSKLSVYKNCEYCGSVIGGGT